MNNNTPAPPPSGAPEPSAVANDAAIAINNIWSWDVSLDRVAVIIDGAIAAELEKQVAGSRIRAVSATDAPQFPCWLWNSNSSVLQSPHWFRCQNNWWDHGEKTGEMLKEGLTHWHPDQPTPPIQAPLTPEASATIADLTARLTQAEQQLAERERELKAVKGRDAETFQACQHWISEFNRAESALALATQQAAEAEKRLKASEDRFTGDTAAQVATIAIRSRDEHQAKLDAAESALALATQDRERLEEAAKEADELLRSCGLFAYISAHADKLRWENRNSPPNNQWGESTFAAIAEDHNKVLRALALLESIAAPSATPSGPDESLLRQRYWIEKSIG